MNDKADLGDSPPCNHSVCRSVYDTPCSVVLARASLSVFSPRDVYVKESACDSLPDPPGCSGTPSMTFHHSSGNITMV